MDPRPLSIFCLLVGFLVYLGAVTGLLFDAATPPLDPGALSLAVCFLAYGGLGLALARGRKPAV